jgi:hypothetical protein
MNSNSVEITNDQLITSIITAPVEQQPTKGVPQCIKDVPVDAARDNLTCEQLEQASSELKDTNFIKLEFPKTRRVRVDPEIANQKIALISFIPSKNATPDSDGCFGVAKIRGVFSNVEEADEWASNLIRNYDSYAEIDFVYVGKEFPVMNDNLVYVNETREVDVRKILDKTTKEYLDRKRDQEKQQIAEIKQRQKELQELPEQEDTESIEYYVRLRVKRATSLMRKDEARAVVNQCNTVIEQTGAELATVEEKHPEYARQYLEQYEKALQETGIKPQDNPLMKYMK